MELGAVEQAGHEPRKCKSPPKKLKYCLYAGPITVLIRVGQSDAEGAWKTFSKMDDEWCGEL